MRIMPRFQGLSITRVDQVVGFLDEYYYLQFTRCPGLVNLD